MEEHRRRDHFRPWRSRLLWALAAVCCHAQDSTPAADPPPTTSETAPATLQVWLDALAKAESGNRQFLIHRDRDGQLYYGCLQFQERTFRVYARKFHLIPQGTSHSETMRRIYDCAFQKQLAALMIRDDPRNWKHWRTTVEKRVGMPPVEAKVEAKTEEPAP